MTAQLDRRSSLTLGEILKAVKSLAPDDQARLLDELAGVNQVYITKPDNTRVANQRGQKLAEQLRSELHASSKEELDQAMSQLRGRKWSS